MTEPELHAILGEISNLPPERQLNLIVLRFKEHIKETERLQLELHEAQQNIELYRDDLREFT